MTFFKSKISSGYIKTDMNTGQPQIILSQTYAIDLEHTLETMQPIHLLCLGSTGSGKTYHCARPNILACDTDYVVLDPRNELCSQTEETLIAHNYRVFIVGTENNSANSIPDPVLFAKDASDIHELAVFLVKDFHQNNPSDDPFFETAEIKTLSLLLTKEKMENKRTGNCFAEVAKRLTNPESDELHTFLTPNENDEEYVQEWYRDYLRLPENVRTFVFISLSNLLDRYSEICFSKYDPITDFIKEKGQKALFLQPSLFDETFTVFFDFFLKKVISIQVENFSRTKIMPDRWTKVILDELTTLKMIPWADQILNAYQQKAKIAFISVAQCLDQLEVWKKMMNMPEANLNPISHIALFLSQAYMDRRTVSALQEKGYINKKASSERLLKDTRGSANYVLFSERSSQNSNITVDRKFF